MNYKIEKNTVQETLILPLYSRKLCTELYPNLYRDETAVRLLDQIDYDFSETEKNSRSLMQRFGALAAALPGKNVLFAFALSAGHREIDRVVSIDLKKLRGNTAYLNRVLDANIEGYRAIRDAGHTILPKEDADFEGEKYRKTCLRFFKLMCATSLGKLCASDHAMNAIDEMSALNRDLKRFYDENGVAYPVWKELEAEVGRYLQ